MTEQPPLLSETSGEALRARRLKLGLSLQQVAEQIKCPVNILQALELDESVSLAKVYLRGHIKRYCALLEMDDELCGGLLDRHGNESPDVQTIFETRPHVPRSDRWLRVASYVLASLLVGTLAWQVTHEAVRLTTSMEVPESGAQPSDTETQDAPASHVNASIASLESLHGPMGSRTGNAGLQAWRAIEATRSGSVQAGDGAHRLVLETSADSWVEISGANDELLEQDLLRGGERRQYRDNGPFRVSLGRSSAVNLTLDGKPIDLEPFTRDDVARLLLDPASTSANPLSTQNVEPQEAPGAGETTRQTPEG